MSLSYLLTLLIPVLFSVTCPDASTIIHHGRKLSTLFIKITGGSCTTSGRRIIKNIDDCALGHRETGGSLASAQHLQTNYYAPGCSQTPSGTYLNWNTGKSNNYVTVTKCSYTEVSYSLVIVIRGTVVIHM